jgi:hypothetical protein
MLGVAAGWLVAGAATANGPGGGAAAAITIPATIATTPPMAPAASSRTVQEPAGFVPGTGPLPVNGCLAGAGPHGASPGQGTAAAARVSGVPWANSAGQGPQTGRHLGVTPVSPPVRPVFPRLETEWAAAL